VLPVDALVRCHGISLPDWTPLGSEVPMMTILTYP
jgi:hypothetical protein